MEFHTGRRSSRFPILGPQSSGDAPGANSCRRSMKAILYIASPCRGLSVGKGRRASAADRSALQDGAKFASVSAKSRAERRPIRAARVSSRPRTLKLAAKARGHAPTSSSRSSTQSEVPGLTNIWVPTIATARHAATGIKRPSAVRCGTTSGIDRIAATSTRGDRWRVTLPLPSASRRRYIDVKTTETGSPTGSTSRDVQSIVSARSRRQLSASQGPAKARSGHTSAAICVVKAAACGRARRARRCSRS